MCSAWNTKNGAAGTMNSFYNNRLEEDLKTKPTRKWNHAKEKVNIKVPWRNQ